MRSNILLVDDNQDMLELMGTVLANVGQVHFASSGSSAIQHIRHTPPDLMLLDAELPDMTGFQVCEALKVESPQSEFPVIFVTGYGDHAFELKGLESGAVDFIAKPFNPSLLVARVQNHLRMKRMADELRSLATIDALTEVANRRRFDEQLPREWGRGLRNGHPISLLLLDVDCFKQFNDHYGHPAGDDCLRQVAQVLKNIAQRPADLVARYGGEEFALLLPQTTRIGAAHIAHRILNAAESLAIPHAASPVQPHVTLSIGIGCYDEDSLHWARLGSPARFHASPARTPADLVESADKALYAAKHAGRAQAWWLDIDLSANPEAAAAVPGILREPTAPR